MPKIKIKTHSGAKKRFNLTKNGKVKRAHANKRHILNKKTTKRKRGLRAGAYADRTNEAAIKRMILYKYFFTTRHRRLTYHGKSERRDDDAQEKK